MSRETELELFLKRMDECGHWMVRDLYEKSYLPYKAQMLIKRKEKPA